MTISAAVASISLRDQRELSLFLGRTLHLFHIAARDAYEREQVAISDFVHFNEVGCKLASLLEDLLESPVDAEAQVSMLQGVDDWATTDTVRVWLRTAVAASQSDWLKRPRR